MEQKDPLDLFSPAARAWFRENFGAPTPPQAEGWPAIQRGEHVLILAPTGSGKTLAAFLWGIDRLYRERTDAVHSLPPGVRLLYVSPLKALNNDIERNLRRPLEGIRQAAECLGSPLPPLRVAVRTGDTPAHVRASIVKKPPDILITTPESLYLMLSSPRAREIFRQVQTVIVDEIHTLCGNKRGAHLSLSLERLCELAPHSVQRVGLSATIKPLEEVARFLGGQQWTAGPEDDSHLIPRPVTIINTGYRKPLALRVITVVPDFGDMPGDSIYPSIIPRLLQQVREHHSTLIFCNNRRLAERTADRLNAQLAAEQSEEIEPGSTHPLAPGGVPIGQGIFAIGAAGPVRAHHGSMSREARLQMEQDLKAGRLPVLVGTSSLELGIDIGSIDLVIQLQSPKSVAQGLQRVGRAGHVVGETSIGQIYPTFRDDLVEAAAVAHGMLEGEVEPTYTPQNPLDVLAQQIVAMVGVAEWSVPALFKLVRQGYPYQNLTPGSFELVLKMLSGRYQEAFGNLHGVNAAALRPKLSWDRVNDRLVALPGTRLLAISNGGTIPDTGAFGVYLGDGKTKLGELDEEFVYETRVGNVFMLGSHVWKVLEIADDRIVVGDAAGDVPRMPFWHGDMPWRPYELGARIGRFKRELAHRLREEPGRPDGVREWLAADYALDPNSIANLLSYLGRQLAATGTISTDRAVLLETFQDGLGDPRLVIHSPFGGRVNGAWALALSSALREQLGTECESQANDDGIIFRFPATELDVPFDKLVALTPAEARERILRELPDSALFGAHFRMNAARALLLPRSKTGRRTPFWLQRLKARDLLNLVRRFEDFPIVAETFRDCLRDVLDLPHLQEVLRAIQKGQIELVQIETLAPSPVAAGLLFNFAAANMYQWDAPKAERQLQALSFRRDVLEDLLQGIDLRELLQPEALTLQSAQSQHTAEGTRARSREELAYFLSELGDLSDEELMARSARDPQPWLAELQAEGRISPVPIPTPAGIARRWVPVELEQEYQAAFPPDAPCSQAACQSILLRLLRNSGPLTEAEILARYSFPSGWLSGALDALTNSRVILRGRFTPDRPLSERELVEVVDRENLQQIHRRTLTILRSQVQPVPFTTFADFLAEWQHSTPASRLAGEAGLAAVLEQLSGITLPLDTWQSLVLPARLTKFVPRQLQSLVESGEWAWAAEGRDSKKAGYLFFRRGAGSLWLPPPAAADLSAMARQVSDFLKAEGASLLSDLVAGLQLPAREIGASLSELAGAGLVTADSFPEWETPRVAEAIEAIPSRSALERELALRLERPRQLTTSRYRDARRRVTARLSGGVPLPPRPVRWSLVHRQGLLGPPQSATELAPRAARALLLRYGVLTRDILVREGGPWDWASLYRELQRLELQGHIRRGYFVTGFSGLQYALPDAVERLRAHSTQSSESCLALNATDPANLYGPTRSEGPQTAAGGALHFSRIPSNSIVLQGGRPVLLAEEDGARLTTMEGVDSALALLALRAFLERPGGARHFVVLEWNGSPVLETGAPPLLQSIGLHRTPVGLEWWDEPWRAS